MSGFYTKQMQPWAGMAAAGCVCFPETLKVGLPWVQLDASSQALLQEEQELSDKGGGLELSFPQPGALLFPFLWGRVPLQKKTTERRGTLFLTSLLEDLDWQNKDKARCLANQRAWA